MFTENEGKNRNIMKRLVRGRPIVAISAFLCLPYMKYNQGVRNSSEGSIH